eukprot:4597794-Prorocentrum_lima.AAC.1
MRQKAKEAAIKLETGKKDVPKSKPKHIEFGDDDCGEDYTSIAWVDTVSCPFDHGAPAYLVQELSLEPEDYDSDHELFLVEFEADLNPRDWLKGSAC